ncbi:Putative major facilitator superfamily, MFS transporter superfamily [Septoria linicola]|uniref:Major facilitator superfamily, MFS transporter superfamily n=1 Tax=Septoria linicola TaxID=215465 RepID=A0A9Q9EK85_9PEZI|nr:putative major facilitator superfamily, MFS transporter superfamily [Septoria linicola]USW52997.1 Putative major facilitator superfamily, MFS transporter superfamily [Septoria linicola]
MADSSASEHAEKSMARVATPHEAATDRSGDMETNHHTRKENGDRPACFSSTVQEILFVVTATMAIGMTSFLAGSITVTSSFIGRDLDMSTAEITWISSASSLSNGAFLLFFGKIADLFGRKLLFLDVLNGLLGLFSASAVPPAVGLLGIVYEKPSKRKNYAFACFSAGNPLGFVAGTIFGGIATSLFGWRASFWLIAIIFIVFTAIAFFTVPKDFTAKEDLSWNTLKRFDVVGAILTVGGIGMFSAALSIGDTAHEGWKTPYVLALLIVGLGLIIGFVFWELYFPYPLMPMSIWKDRNFTLVLSILMLGFVAFTPAAFFSALYFQTVWNMGALQVAVHVLPMAINGTLVNSFAGWALNEPNLEQTSDGRCDSYWSFCFPGLILIVVGADLEFNVANMYVMSSMPPSQQSTAGGIFQTVTKLCMAIGLGIATAVFNAEKREPTMSSYWDQETQPYAAVFWMATAASALSICLVPFLTLGTQGNRQSSVAAQDDAASVGNVQETAKNG